MTDTTPNTPKAGWYPDPDGEGRIQWWDGDKWTPNYAKPAGAAAATSADARPYGYSAEELAAPAGTSPYTPFVWVLALLPAVNFVLGVLSALTVDEQIQTSLSADPNAVFTPAYFLSLGLSLLITALVVVFAVLDHRALVRAGVPRPFHWAWSLFALVNVPVYIIGRSVIVRRRTGSGLAPMFVNLAFWLATLVLGIVVASITITTVLEQLPPIQ